MFTVTRSEHNPLLSPVHDHPWEAVGAFNASPIIRGKKTYLIYRAVSHADRLQNPHFAMSVIAQASSLDGHTYSDRAVFIAPSEEFDRYGCEDPRITKFKDTYYVTYTALGGFPFSKDTIKVGVALSKDLKTVDEKHIVTPFNAKAMAIFPEPINGKMAALLTINTDQPPSDICYAEFDKPKDLWSPKFWNAWKEKADEHTLQIRRTSNDQIELGAQPLKTSKGWLVIYSHIQNYFSGTRVFGIEALLLDLKYPKRIIGRTKGPFMVPETYYEHIGNVPQVVFPSGALIRKGNVELYYGAADTHTAMATIPLDTLLASLTEPAEKHIVRFPGNPIIAPREGVHWEDRGTLNPAAIDINKKIYILYRAVSDMNVSTLGLAVSSDGARIQERSDAPVYVPRAIFEKNNNPLKDCGCEDPRIVKIGQRLYMTYTGYNGSIPRVTATSISIKDFEQRKWEAWSEPQTVSPDGIDDKDAVIIPEMIDGKYMIIHRIDGVICADFVSSLDFSKEKIKKCIEILEPRPGMWDGAKVGISVPPLRTKEGWLVLYHGVSSEAKYRVGAILLDSKDPTNVIGRTAAPFLEPETDYEKNGVVPNVVFPCGMIQRGDDLLIYYGGADRVVCVATVKLQKILSMLKS